jgi:hypothetical protein
VQTQLNLFAFSNEEMVIIIVLRGDFYGKKHEIFISPRCIWEKLTGPAIELCLVFRRKGDGIIGCE